jgi:hypothetical protein
LERKKLEIIIAKKWQKLTFHKSYSTIRVLVLNFCLLFTGAWGSAVVKVLRYQSDGPGIDFRWCHWIFQWHISFRPYRGPGVDSAPSENEYQEHFLGLKAAFAWGWQPHHLQVPNVMGEPKSPATLWATPGLLRDSFNFIFNFLLAYGKEGRPGSAEMSQAVPHWLDDNSTRRCYSQSYIALLLGSKRRKERYLHTASVKALRLGIPPVYRKMHLTDRNGISAPRGTA